MLENLLAMRTKVFHMCIWECKSSLQIGTVNSCFWLTSVLEFIKSSSSAGFIGIPNIVGCIWRFVAVVMTHMVKIGYSVGRDLHIILTFARLFCSKIPLQIPYYSFTLTNYSFHYSYTYKIHVLVRTLANALGWLHTFQQVSSTQCLARHSLLTQVQWCS